MGIKQILLLVLIVIMSFLFGTIGFHLIENWSLFDSFYMTMITLTTVGFGEVHALSQAGKVFTVFLIFIGLGIVSFSITTMMSYMLNFDFK
ncbi:MAG: two pore domain potassium channel family protein, partial [Halobacteriovoraceae bacterium]|nr:two pore domain potassium channel family protein [Halobacteriovoraceae bacterium]